MIIWMFYWFTCCRYAEFLDASPALANLLYLQPDKLLPLFDAGAREAQVRLLSQIFDYLCRFLALITSDN